MFWMVEKRAAELFLNFGHAEIGDTPPAAFRSLWDAHDVVVAVDPQGTPVGFAAASDVLQGRFFAEVPPGVGAETRILMVRYC